ncbi:bacteriophage T4 gp5 trimerization domain-containing protein, partial [Pseudomonas fluorescens]|uniref:bacteriophage T4 gp5 trimerisation domain-containing protein n=1 Tax=Pseudomonas fluorescens TaxID=294 RepID=UPI003D08485A
ANKTRSTFKTLSSPGGKGYNEFRIEDKKGAEQIYLHAQRDWDENIEHDQKIRVGNERHDTVEANTLTELKAEEHRITHLDRKTEARADDHLTVGVTQHMKVGTAQFVEAGTEIHYHAGEKVVVEGGMELTAKAGGSFVKVDAGGVTISGAEVKVNSGGSAGSGTGIGILMPGLPLIADQARAGNILKSGTANSEKFDEQIRFVTGLGQPIKSVKAAIIVPSSVAPKISKSNADGLHPRVETDTAETAEVHLMWDELIVPPGSDDYEASRNK